MLDVLGNDVVLKCSCDNVALRVAAAQGEGGTERENSSVRGVEGRRISSGEESYAQ